MKKLILIYIILIFFCSCAGRWVTIGNKSCDDCYVNKQEYIIVHANNDGIREVQVFKLIRDGSGRNACFWIKKIKTFDWRYNNYSCESLILLLNDTKKRQLQKVHGSHSFTSDGY